MGHVVGADAHEREVRPSLHRKRHLVPKHVMGACAGDAERYEVNAIPLRRDPFREQRRVGALGVPCTYSGRGGVPQHRECHFRVGRLAEGSTDLESRIRREVLAP